LGDACEYSRRATNIGGDANILRGATAGTGEYVWVVGDDDVLLPGAIAETLRMIDADRPDRIIHFTPEAAGLVPRGHAGTMGTLIDSSRRRRIAADRGDAHQRKRVSSCVP
jgi:hypothetical protein